MSIHDEHPFLEPEERRGPVRRFRGRLTSHVTVWTAAHESGRVPAGRGEASPGAEHRRTDKAGLTVSSMLVADGEPPRVLGLIDGDSEFWGLASRVGRFAVSPLGFADRALADVFADLRPAPGGPFRLGSWRTTDWGPVPATVASFAGCTVEEVRPMGWALEVVARLDHVELGGDEPAPLLHRRGRYVTLAPT